MFKNVQSSTFYSRENWKVSKSYNTTIQCNSIQHKNEVDLYIQLWKGGYNKPKM